MSLRTIRADLHIHTCLSPCADLRMSPRTIVNRAREAGLDLLAVCDHNSAQNADAVIRASGATPVALPGLEICSSEEVHVLAIFGTLEAALAMQSIVFGHLSGTNAPEVFGDQPVVNDAGEILFFENRLLIGATGLTIGQIVTEIHSLHGLAIASHIDRDSYSVISQLGLIPAGLAFDALEVTSAPSPDSVVARYPTAAGFVLIRNSDAHRPQEIGTRACTYLMERPAFDELRRVFVRADGRTICET